MENNIRFRNHISIVLETALRSMWTVIFILVGSFISDMDEMSQAQIGEEVWILIGILVGVVLISLIWQCVAWARTYISIQDNTLVIERSILGRQRNTIGIKNISNVNLEQNLLEMLLGTCKVKLDTNSLSTANKTDVKIVLKKKDAEAFRQMILQKTETGAEIKEEEQDVPEEEKRFVSDMDDIVMHGVFSINIFSVVALVAAIVGVVFLWGEMEQHGEMVVEILMTILMIVWFLGGMLWNIINGFIKYLEFKIERKGDKVFLSYGLLKKVAYSIPVDKINAVRFTQTALARMGRRYMVEIINVGMDDDENETHSFFLPYAKKEKIEEQMSMLLPEFAGCMEIQEERQPKCIWLIRIPAVVIYLAIIGIGIGIIAEYVPELVVPALIGSGGLSILLLMVQLAEYFTIGCAVDEKFLKVVSGCFGKRSLFVKYNKIQFVTARQNVLAKHFHVQKGTIHLLAAIKNQVHILPYFQEENMEQLKEYILKK